MPFLERKPSKEQPPQWQGAKTESALDTSNRVSEEQLRINQEYLYDMKYRKEQQVFDIKREDVNVQRLAKVAEDNKEAPEQLLD